MDSARFEQEVTFGPFRMPLLQELVNERMRQAFYSYLEKKVVPLLEGQIVRIDGRVFSHYDDPQFAGTAEVGRRYYYEVRLSSRTGVEEAWGELDYDPDTATYAPSRIKPPRVRTLTEVRQIEEARQAKLEFQQRHSQHTGDYCPKCHSKQVAEILYGLYPLPLPASLQADFDSRRIRLGGCCVSETSPKWRCLSCGSEWGILPGVRESFHEIFERRTDQNT
jgi:hypothetical protein